MRKTHQKVPGRKNRYIRTKDQQIRAGNYRSILEADVGRKLEALSVDAFYEPYFMDYIQPQQRRKYKPDWTVDEDIVLEAKGKFDASDRKKMLLLKEQYPDKIFVLLFGNARTKIGKSVKSKTYADWADKHGFVWIDFYRASDEEIKNVLQECRDQRRRDV